MKHAFIVGETVALLAVLAAAMATGGVDNLVFLLVFSVAWISALLCAIGRVLCEATDLADRQVDLLERIAERLGEPIDRPDPPKPAPIKRPPPVPGRLR